MAETGASGDDRTQNRLRAVPKAEREIGNSAADHHQI